MVVLIPWRPDPHEELLTVGMGHAHHGHPRGDRRPCLQSDDLDSREISHRHGNRRRIGRRDPEDGVVRVAVFCYALRREVEVALLERYHHRVPNRHREIRDLAHRVPKVDAGGMVRHTTRAKLDGRQDKGSSHDRLHFHFPFRRQSRESRDRPQSTPSGRRRSEGSRV